MTALVEVPGISFEASTFAPAPAEWRGLARDEVRLLVATPDGPVHARFRDLPDHLSPGDVLVANTSATVPGQLDGLLRRGDGRSAPVVVHVAARLEDGSRVVELRTAPDAARSVLDARAGDRVALAGPGRGWGAGDPTRAGLELAEPWPTGRPSSPTGEGNRLWRATVQGDLGELLSDHGRPIAYGYLDRPYPLEAYQSVFASRPGSAEMASAGRPFTTRLVARLVSQGVLFAPVTLHTGLSSQEAGEAPGPEWFEVPPSTVRLVEHARSTGGRVVAVGTTATRAIESAATSGGLEAARGWTTRVVSPADPPRLVDGLVTGWHDPHASHLLLVEAVAGRDLAQAAYDAAVAEGYLWHEFGDSALLLPERP